jgi:hypothetical protein
MGAACRLLLRILEGRTTTVKVRHVASAAISVALSVGGVAIAAAPASAATRLGGINMQAACDDQYPGQGRIAKIRTWNVYGWKCVTGVVPVADGDISTWRQCQNQFGWNRGVYSNYTNYNDPYSWGCYR